MFGSRSKCPERNLLSGHADLRDFSSMRCCSRLSQKPDRWGHGEKAWRHQMSSNEPGGRCWHAEGWNAPPSRLKWTNAGAEGVHTISTLGDGEDTQAGLLFPRTAVVGGEKEKEKKTFLIHIFLLPSSDLWRDLLQRKHALLWVFAHFEPFWHPAIKRCRQASVVPNIIYSTSVVNPALA